MNLRTYLMIKQAAGSTAPTENILEYLARKLTEGGRAIGSGAKSLWEGTKSKAKAFGKGVKDFAVKNRRNMQVGGGGLVGAMAGDALADALGFEDDYGLGAGIGGATGAYAGFKLPQILAALRKVAK